MMIKDGGDNRVLSHRSHPKMSFYRTITSINRQQQLRGFSTTVFRQSHIGSAPIYLTPDISCKVESIDNPRIVLKGRKSITLSQNIKIGGPRGELGFIVPDFVNVNINGPTAENNNIGKIQVSVNNTDDRIQRSMWGTVSATLRNNITGVTEGHLAILKLVGTGYRATIIDSVANPGKKHVSLKVGASDNQGLDVPDGLTVSSPVPTRVVIEGISKQQVKLFAANLRKFRPPEPYKGKGIFVDNETIKIKDKKIK